MRNYITVAYLALFMVLITIVIVTYRQNEVLESRVNTLYKYSGDLQSEKSFKEDYYIVQQSHDTNVLLVVFAALVAFTGIFTYVNTIEKFNSKVLEMKDENLALKTDWNKTHKKIIKLKGEFIIYAANLDFERARNYGRAGVSKSALEYNLSGLTKLTQYRTWILKYKKNEAGAADNITRTILNHLTRIHGTMVPNMKIDSILNNLLTDYISEIRKNKNQDIDRILFDISAKINVIDDTDDLP